MKIRHYILSLLLGFYSLGYSSAQEIGDGFREDLRVDFTVLHRYDRWIRSANPAGLTSAFLNDSYAEGYTNKSGGKFKPSHVSDNSLRGGLITESVRSYNKITFYGKLQYDYFSGRNMSGSMFIDPERYPVDILEYTPGKKNLETYRLTGAAGFDIIHNLSGGLRIDYEAANYAKRKDLRHKNRLMDLSLTGGLNWSRNGWNAGAHYAYRKNTESIDAEQIGSTGTEYFAFFDKGLWYGESGLWDGSGLHLSESALGLSNFPISENRHSAGLQFGYGDSEWDFINELTYSRLSGKTGERGVIWTQHRSSEWKYEATIHLRHNKTDHFVHLGASYADLDQDETIATIEQINSVSQYVIHGKTRVSSRRTFDLFAEYAWRHGKMGTGEHYHLTAGINYWTRSSISSLMFPAYRKQNIGNTRVHLGGEKEFRTGRTLLTARLKAGYQIGHGGPIRSETVPDSGQDGTGTYAAHQEEFAAMEREWLTTDRFGVEGAIRWWFNRYRVPVPLYADLSADFTRSAKVEYLGGRNYLNLRLALGCKF